MKRSTDRVLTTHTGSLPRSGDMLGLLGDKEKGVLPDGDAFDLGVRRAMAEVVRKQVECGLDVINDGEQGKIDYTAYVTDRLTGFDDDSVPATDPFAGLNPQDTEEFPEYAAMMRQFTSPFQKRPACTGPITWKDWPAVGKEIANLKTATSGTKAEEVFMTSVSPGQIARFLKNQYYPSDEAYLYALADVMKDEYKAIVEAGLVLQLDCPDLALGRHGRFGHLSLEEFRKVAEMHVEVLNHAVADIPPDRMRMHACWGSTSGPHHRDMPLKDIVDVLLKARPAGLCFPGANPRHEHEWKVWKEISLPEGKVIIPGVIDSTSNYVEHPELVAERITRYAGVVGRENMIAGCDCGFGTFASRIQVDSKIVWLKLQSLTEGARLASEELW